MVVKVIKCPHCYKIIEDTGYYINSIPVSKKEFEINVAEHEADIRRDAGIE